jgi:hypothetical protein
MSEFQAKRMTRQHTQKLNATPDKVFPLLCPVKEYDWIDGWQCDMIYSKSGFNEENCIFQTEFPKEGKEIWVTSHYDPENYRVEFVRVSNDYKVIRYNIALSDNGDGRTHADWRQIVTALSEQGNQYITDSKEEDYIGLIKMLETMINHYVTTGKMIPIENIK